MLYPEQRPVCKRSCLMVDDVRAQELCRLSNLCNHQSAGGRPALIKTTSPINKVLELA